MKKTHSGVLAKTMNCTVEDLRHIANRANKTSIFPQRVKVMSISTLRTALLDAAAACCGHPEKYEALMGTLMSGAAHARAKHAFMLDKQGEPVESVDNTGA